MPPFELGLFTFADINPDPAGGTAMSPAERLRNVVEEARVADEVGLDVFAVGEHHRPDFAISAPAVVLAAISERTSRIRLSSAVNVISSDDPVRVFQEFSTVDLLSGGRAEIMAGRGSFIESFPLFGYDLHDYDSLFAEKLEMLIALRSSERITWSGKHRAAIDDRGVYPRPIQDPLPIWVAVGGTPQSAARTGLLGLPMALAIIGGEPARFAPFAEIHRQAALQGGHGHVPMSINSHGFLAGDPQTALDDAWPATKRMSDRIGRERGWSPLSREAYDASATLHGANFIGSPAQVIEKILFQHEIFGHARFLMQFIVGALPHAKVLRAIELFGSEVAPVVRAEIARRTAAPAVPPA